MSQFYVQSNSGGGLPSNVPTSFVTDMGTVIPAANVVNVNGGPGVTVSANPNNSNNMVISVSASGGPHCLVTQFSSNGSFTPNAGSVLMAVYAIGGGGGGGSGRRGAIGSNRAGGGGGGAGGVSFVYLNPARVIAGTSVVIGQGGTGGAAIMTDDTDGNAGNIGTSTTFGGRTLGVFGQGGGGGSTSGGQGGSGAIGTMIMMPSTEQDGASGSVTAGNSPLSGFIGPSAGAGGGGIDTFNTSYNGGTGSNVLLGEAPNNTIFPQVFGGAPGVAPGGNGVSGSNTSGVSSYFATGGGGGGGGAGNNAGIGGNGGAGGLYGAGGAGGGASVDSFNSGAGGNGANGFLMVLEWF